jgi:hypothetical protein
MRSTSLNSNTHAGRRRGLGSVADPRGHVHSPCDLPCGHCYVFQAADQTWRSRPRAVPDEVVVQVAPHQARNGICGPGTISPLAGTSQPATRDEGRDARSAAWGVVALVAGGGATVIGVSAAGPMLLCAGGLALLAVVGIFLCFATAHSWFPFRRRRARRELAPDEAEPTSSAALSPEQNSERRYTTWFAELKLTLRVGRRGR